jgi:hypothetical protein
MNPPTYQEFVIAREEAKYDSEHSEDAYQVCRWYRGHLLLRERAERWLKAHRSERAA